MFQASNISILERSRDILGKVSSKLPENKKWAGLGKDKGKRIILTMEILMEGM